MAARLLLLSVSAGAGHVRAAQALEAAAKLARPPFTATHLDLLTLVPKDFKKLYGEQYIKLVERLPQLWSFLYSKSDRPTRDSLVGRLKRAAEKLNTRKLDAEIERLAPDVILCTHFLRRSCCRAGSAANGAPKRPPVGAGHDFDVHALWVHPHVIAIALPAEVAYRLADRGVPATIRSRAFP
jgi:processive 1,2-diacylglycerol beta-glucosyltransferase